MRMCTGGAGRAGWRGGGGSSLPIMYLRTTDSICLGVKRPLNVSLPSGSSEQGTPNSALKYDITCSCLFSSVVCLVIQVRHHVLMFDINSVVCLVQLLVLFSCSFSSALSLVQLFRRCTVPWCVCMYVYVYTY